MNGGGSEKLAGPNPPPPCRAVVSCFFLSSIDIRDISYHSSFFFFLALFVSSVIGEKEIARMHSLQELSRFHYMILKLTEHDSDQGFVAKSSKVAHH